MSEMYLIFEAWAHTSISFARGDSVTDAITNYLRAEWSPEQLIVHPAGSAHSCGVDYPHILAFVEATYKIHFEWQIRHLSEQTWRSHVTEVFAGEDEEETQAVIDNCRPLFRQTHPRSRAKAFVWYLNQGPLITFYRKTKPHQIEILGRYLWEWDDTTKAPKEWHGDYQAIADSLDLKTYILLP